MTYTIVKQGYQPLDLSLSLSDAEKEASKEAAAMLADAKRNHKSARKHKLSPGCYRITLGPDKNSTAWGHVSVIQN